MGGEHIIYPGEFRTAAAKISAGVKGFASLCSPLEHDTTRSSVAFAYEGVNLCFYTPNAGDYLTCMSVFGVGRSRELKFIMYVSGVGFEVHDPRATLDVNGQSLTSSAEARDFSYGGGFEEASPGAKPINPGAPHLIYSIPRVELVFRFKLLCDANAHYRLSIQGIGVDGHGIEVPSVDFDPYTEWVQRYLD